MRLFPLLWLITITAFSQPFEGYIPPGTIHFSGNLFIQTTEVSNLQWQEFEYFARKDSAEKYHQSIIPSNEVTKSYRPNYYRDAGFKDFPVVGISHEHAQEYCRWLTRVVNRKNAVMYDNKALSVNLEVKYRLPSELEWTIIARQADTMKFSKPGKYFVEELVNSKNLNGLINSLGNSEVSIREVKSALKDHYRNDTVPDYRLGYTRPWFATIIDQLPERIYYPDNESKLNYDAPINLIGNVAEMVQEPGITKGGSWRHKLAVSFPGKSILINPQQVYDWVGFRCICVVSYAE